jgi:spore coat polysaccharide biosynthesis predicted glycosyltransferase SpsG
MKVLLRADASVTQGTGHVMRVLTLGDELAAAGHDVHLASAASNIPWLENLVSSKPFARHSVRAHSLDAELIDQIAPDWVVVDSYEIPGSLIGAARTHARVLAIVDGDDRGIDADLYLDHNVGAERLTWPAHVAERMLAGSEFALVRRAIRDVKRVDPWKFSTGTPRVLAVLGGSDPTGMIVDVVEEVSHFQIEDLEPPPDFGDAIDARFIVGMAKSKGTVKTVLDIDRLLSHVGQIDLRAINGRSAEA